MSGRSCALLAAVAVALHGLFVASRWLEDLDAHHPLIDGAYYLELARHWASGGLAPPDGGLLLLPPGYPLFLAALVPFVGTSYWIVFAVQAVLATVGLVALTRLAAVDSGRWPALAAAMLALLYGPHQLLTASLASEALVLPLMAAFFSLEGRPRGTLLQAVVLGAAYLVRPNLGVFIIFWLVWLMLREPSRLRRAAWVLVALAPIPVLHWYTTGSAMGGSAQAGVALYMGNHPGAAGLFTNSLGLRGDMHEMADQVLAITGHEVGRTLDAPEASRYWVGRVVDWAREDPTAFAGNLVLKALRTIDSHEYATDHQWLADFPSAARFFPVPFAVLAALAAAGVLGGRWDRRTEPVLLYLAAVTAGLLLFYPSSRLRYQLLPALVLLAARGLRLVAERRPVAIAAAVAIGLVSVVGVRDDRRTEDPFGHFNRARLSLDASDPAAALLWVERAIGVRGDVSFFHTLRAEALAMQNRPDASRRALTVAFLLGEDAPEVINRLGGDALRRRDWVFAETVFRRAVESYPRAPAAWMNLVQALLAQGRAAEASEGYARAVALGGARRLDLERVLSATAAETDGGVASVSVPPGG